MREQPGPATFLFTDIEGSTRLWEQQPDAMRVALARHDDASRHSVQAHQGRIVKSTGDGIHAVFDDAADAVQAVLALQQALARADTPLPLAVRCGLHCGAAEARDGDYYGPVLNRAARIMAAAHGGQVLLSQAVADRLAGRLPDAAALRDLGLVRLRDLSSPERVHQLLHPALREQFPPLRSLQATPNNLAQQLNSFVGRERELADVRALLAQHRLVTLLGMGGIGKSRLSVQLGAELLDDFADGVWLVELAPLADARSVPQALASVLGVKEAAGQTVTASLLDHVRDRQLLVILDNCEHLVHACADLARQLLQAAPGVKLLASSRDALQLAGETCYSVPTLRVPALDLPGEAPPDPALLAQHEAVRLFVDRASAAQAAFRLTPANALAVATICRQLDGIPLAIELAAARTRALAVPAIAERLADRFRLLVSHDQTVLPRQRTLRALIDWSFDLLSEPERALLRRLAVFAGGFTLEAAEAVGGGDGTDSADVLDLLALLVGKSLVVMDAEGGRYRMLETVRAYAAEKLAQAGDEAGARARHVAHYLALAETARRQLVGPEQGHWLDILDRERENLLGAHDWCGRWPEGRAQGLQLVFVLKNYWRIRGLLGLGHRVTVEAAARVGADERSFARSRVLCDAGQLCYFSGRYDEALRYLVESHAIAQEIGDATRLAAVLQPLGMVYVGLGERDNARRIFESAVALARQLGDRRQLAAALNTLAQLQHADGDLAAADGLYSQTLDMARELGDQESVAIALLNRAMVAVTQGRADDALAMLNDVHAIAPTIGSRPVDKSLLEVCAGLCAWRGDAAGAARLFGAAEALGLATGISRDASDEAFVAPLMQQARQRLGQPAFDAEERAGRALQGDALAQALRGALAATRCS